MLDMGSLVDSFDPDAPLPWVIEPFAIAGTLAILAGKSGTGKTWIIHEAADAVQRGKINAGMNGHEPLPTLIIDAEMGEWLTTDRFKTVGYSTNINVFNAGGLDLLKSEDRQLVWDAAIEILGPRGGLLCVDSLRAIVPSAKENDSDQMAPIVTWLKNLCRKTNAAGILIHHAGWREERTRGSSAIVDQADAVWYLSRVDPEEPMLRLTCQGADLKAPRWGPPPRDLYLRIAEEGGLVLADAPRDKAVDMRENVLRVIGEADPPLRTKAEVSRALGKVTANQGISDAVTTLQREGEIVLDSRGFFRISESLGTAPVL